MPIYSSIFGQVCLGENLSDDENKHHHRDRRPLSAKYSMVSEIFMFDLIDFDQN